MKLSIKKSSIMNLSTMKVEFDDIENEYNEIEPNVIQLDEIERYELDDTESGYDEIEPIETMPNKIELNEIDQNEINNNDIESNKLSLADVVLPNFFAATVCFRRRDWNVILVI
ncbi:hypothetical protein EDC96DRAFT_550375 [Choanephora cucurbitarum]|nr:hypothetical protein EDC96DRAFT_550375 [Choanephora cucurbitarum]